MGILFLSLFSFAVLATEIDDTTSYYLKIADSEDYLDFKVQEIFDQTLMHYSGCKRDVFLKGLAYRLTGDVFYGVIERFANDSVTISKVTSSVADSIYKNTPYEKSIVGRLFGLGAVINLHGHHVGTDKLSHFLDIGNDLYWDHRAHHSIARLLETIKNQEEGILGFVTTGVKSYGDMAADMDGFRFWSEVIDEGASNPYFACENNRLRQVRKFHWADYVSSAWTEAVNCSEYSSADYDSSIKQNIERFESDQDVRFECPIELHQCEELRRTYSSFFPGENIDMILSPLCR